MPGGGRGWRLKVAPTADADGEKEKQEAERKKLAKEKIIGTAAKFSLGCRTHVSAKPQKERGRGSSGRGAKNLTYCGRGWYGGGGRGEGNPSRGREFYKTAIVVGGVSCRPFAGRL